MSNKIDRIIEVLIEDIDVKELWHVVFNKMTNPAKRQMISELLNTILGSTYNAKGQIFEGSKKVDMGFWDKNGKYQEDYQIVAEGEWKNG